MNKQETARKLKTILMDYSEKVFNIADLSRDKGANFLLTFNNPILPFNDNSWVGLSYDSKSKTLMAICNGTPRVDLPRDFVDYVSRRFYGSEHSQASFFHEWKNVDLNEKYLENE